jgi:hypothetical protein
MDKQQMVTEENNHENDIKFLETRNLVITKKEYGYVISNKRIGDVISLTRMELEAIQRLGKIALIDSSVDDLVIYLDEEDETKEGNNKNNIDR